jgi:serine/threonine protein phosphatase 1
MRWMFGAESSGSLMIEQVVLVFLGDIVDRGFESRRAMDLVGQALIGHPGSALIFGNHDSFFVLFLPQHLLAQ